MIHSHSEAMLWCRRAGVLFISIAISVLISACDAPPEKELLGTWERDQNFGRFRRMEFLSDGTVAMRIDRGLGTDFTDLSGKFSIVDKRLKIEATGMFGTTNAQVYEFAFVKGKIDGRPVTGLTFNLVGGDDHPSILRKVR